VDLRVGGKVRVVMRKPDGTDVEARGEYALIDRPHRLVMTWTFGDEPLNEQLIELSFSESEAVLVGRDAAVDQQHRRCPGLGMARVPRPARAGTGRLIRRTADRMEPLLRFVVATLGAREKQSSLRCEVRRPLEAGRAC